ncbi:ABC transporter permease [Sulfuracidifex metallicus]|uniref:ABC transporter permease subunit n=1 Tax=Sulfuracidifex metallicus DSM 6482 = JCM 9184 TaxID=523847 RepID=A0A6A9QVS7_SULME|nr:ABC transporter permease [Sulfuracidifex metallicus]MUN29863.1 ABC transporter permease subunit [Sulfuracidifex metallicus DSM 6482 = JCM 9184]WOE51752.1 ABC transporter permease [Sulfuracidifex metallicus DSM 6482 = JCM 9184]
MTEERAENKPRKEIRTTGLRFYLSAIRRDKLGLLGLIIVSLFFGWSAIEGALQMIGGYLHNPSLGWALLPSDPLKISLTNSYHPPTLSAVYLFGANAEGESILSRILYAMPRDALVSVVVVFIAVLVGMIVGVLAGYIGGILDDILMRLTDAILAFPAIILVIAISVILSANFNAVIVGLSVVWWPTYARLFRAQTLKVKQMDYVTAAKLYGVSKVKFFLKYLVLNTIDPIIAYSALDFGNVILAYSTLAFFGIGITVNIPELGEMASDGLAGLPTYWWWPIFPSIAILIIVLGFVLLGDRLQDIIQGRSA